MGIIGLQLSGGNWQRNRASRQARGYGASWDRIRAVAMRRDKYLCQPCLKAGRVTPATECDHVVPKFDGGTDEIDNLQAICRQCHADKTQREAKKAQGCKEKIEYGVDGWPQ